MLSQIDLDRLTALHAAATPGEWTAVENHVYWDIKVGVLSIGDTCASTSYNSRGKSSGDIELSKVNAQCAVEIHNAFPAMRDEIIELRQRVRNLLIEQEDERLNRTDAEAMHDE